MLNTLTNGRLKQNGFESVPVAQRWQTWNPNPSWNLPGVGRDPAQPAAAAGRPIAPPGKEVATAQTDPTPATPTNGGFGFFQPEDDSKSHFRGVKLDGKGRPMRIELEGRRIMLSSLDVDQLTSTISEQEKSNILEWYKWECPKLWTTQVGSAGDVLQMVLVSVYCSHFSCHVVEDRRDTVCPRTFFIKYHSRLPSYLCVPDRSTSRIVNTPQYARRSGCSVGL